MLPKAYSGTVRDLLKKVDERGVAKDLAKELGVKDLMSRELSKLSGGELQKVAIIAAASKKADVYYFDEPASFCDIKEGIYTAILGKAPFEDKEDIEKKIDEQFPDVADFLSHEIGSDMLSELVRQYHEHFGRDAQWKPGTLKRLVHETTPAGKWLEQFAGWLNRHETIQNYRAYEVMASYLEAFDKGCTAYGTNKLP